MRISTGTPYRQIHLSNNALATVVAPLSGMVTISEYYVKASVMVRMYFLFWPDVTSGPNRSA